MKNLERISAEDREKFEALVRQMASLKSGDEIRDLAIKIFDLGYDVGFESVERCDCDFNEF